MLDLAFICIDDLGSEKCSLVTSFNVLDFIYIVHFGSEMFDFFRYIHLSGLLDMLLLLYDRYVIIITWAWRVGLVDF